MDKRTWRYDDPILQMMYREERNKLSALPDADTDFTALDNALKIYRGMEVTPCENVSPATTE